MTQYGGPPPVPPQVLGYQNPSLKASPAPLGAASPLWREGDLFVTTLRAALPPQCVKCNETAPYRWRRTVYWHHPALWFLMLVGLGVLPILLMRKQAYIDLAVCEIHRRVRMQRILIGWAAAGLSLLLLFCSFYCFGGHTSVMRTAGTILVILSTIGLLCSAVWGIVATPYLACRRIKNGYAWYAGAGQDFLAPLSSAR